MWVHRSKFTRLQWLSILFNKLFCSFTSSFNKDCTFNYIIHYSFKSTPFLSNQWRWQTYGRFWLENWTNTLFDNFWSWVWCCCSRVRTSFKQYFQTKLCTKKMWQNRLRFGRDVNSERVLNWTEKPCPFYKQTWVCTNIYKIDRLVTV